MHLMHRKDSKQIVFDTEKTICFLFSFIEINGIASVFGFLSLNTKKSIFRCINNHIFPFIDSNIYY